jgi:hypothetical protein
MFRKLTVVGMALLLQASPNSQTQPIGTAGSANAKPGSFDQEIQRHAQQLIEEGRKIFRFDTFGDEAFWGDQLKLHQAVAGAKFGGVGPGLSPTKALELGLKIDSEMVPAEVAAGLKAGKIDLNDPANTIALLKANAIRPSTTPSRPQSVVVLTAGRIEISTLAPLSRSRRISSRLPTCSELTKQRSRKS